MAKKQLKSDSGLQSKIEKDVLLLLENEYNLNLKATIFQLEGTKIQIDAINDEESHAFEIYARTGKLNAGARGKIARDILKLSMLKKIFISRGKQIQVHIVLVDDVTCKSLKGKNKTNWLFQAAKLHDIEILVIENFPHDLLQKLKIKQEEQYI